MDQDHTPALPVSQEPEPDVSVILPTYNEQGNAVRIVEVLHRQMQDAGRTYEILVMDDRSSDGTVGEILGRFGDDPRTRVVVRAPPRGLAFSIRDGIHAARGVRVLVMDSDFNHDPELTARMVLFSEHYDIVSGSRFMAGGGMQSRFRWWCSLAFNQWIRILLMLPTQDNLAGFFCMKRRDLLALGTEAIFCNYGDYFFRLLYFARDHRLSILEIPVWYKDRECGVSKTSFLRTLWLYTVEAVKLRVRTWRR